MSVTARTPSVPSFGEDLAGDLARAAVLLARRFAVGATLWCVSPAWPHHARHIAVEFVHPVIVGKRALPAVAIGGEGIIPQLRANVRPGDVLVVMAERDDPTVSDLARRAEAWGAVLLWLGAGETPPAGMAHQTLWLDGSVADCSRDGRFILLYHLLWELTHVCFEQPAALAVSDDCGDEVCITCSDEGRPGEVVSRSGMTATVRTARGTEEVDLTLVGALEPHALVLIHAGMAIAALGAGP